MEVDRRASTVGLAERGDYDIRLEAAIAKMYNTEAGWQIVDDDAADPRRPRLRDRGLAARARREADPVERAMRDLRINLIFEGSSEIMRLFIAREAVDPHLQRAGALFEPDASLGAKAASVAGLGVHMAGWVGGNIVGWGRWPRYAEYGPLARHLRYADRTARKMARTLAWLMTRHGPGLEKRQMLLFRLVDVGAELCAIAMACVRAREMAGQPGADHKPYILADTFCRGARRRIARHFNAIHRNDDTANYRVARQILAGEHSWLETGYLHEPAATAAKRTEREKSVLA